MAGGREGEGDKKREGEGKWRDIKSANPCTFCLPLLLLASISLYSISLFCNAVIKTKKTQTDIGDKIHPIKAHAPKLTEVTPHDAVSYSYRVKPPQVLSMSTKATPIKPSTFRIRLGFWEKKLIKMLECYFNMKLRKGLAVQSCREHTASSRSYQSFYWI